jgi:hypothetical protein
MNPVPIALIVLAIMLAVAWDAFCLYDLIRADPAKIRYLPKWVWALVCLISCPWGGLLYVLVGRNAFGKAL